MQIGSEPASVQPRVGIFQTRATLIAALLFCVYEALPRSLTTLRIGGPPEPHERPVLLFGIVASMIISTLIASRSPAIGDRVVFGAGAVSSVLWLLRDFVLTAPRAAAAINGFLSLLWALAAVFTVVLMTRTAGSPRASRQ